MRKFEVVSDSKRKTKIEIQLPTRSDLGSAGYDFYTPIDFEIKPNETKIIFTDVKARMFTNEVLMLYVRSSMGIKKHIVLANGTGIVDSTYYNNIDNEGNIGIALTNIGDETQSFKIGDRIAQGIFLEYLTTEDDKVINETRHGGFGSTGE